MTTQQKATQETLVKTFAGGLLNIEDVVSHEGQDFCIKVEFTMIPLPSYGKERSCIFVVNENGKIIDVIVQVNDTPAHWLG